ncbi:CaiB/BaiF CoA transferase family protein [Enterovirga aerilata]|uniref:CoA transferase n=1 Tax=Enterovirga aerilata TaxID=2730920 RepID=A0A849I5W0_9HYPH|nr:CoA transferase [Enterovirga sp. DB1703]NNM72768.1 CoA transferase [Enterovirga sp. DB1703]
MNEIPPGPLAGIRVLDLTSVLMGPFATLQLGDLGADVIKVEPPEGDIVREIGPGRGPKMGGMFLHTNRSKRSIVIDLKRPEGRDALLRLAATADVMIFNMRPKALARLGLDYGSVRAVRPDIVFVGLVGFGQEGPYAARPAYDDLIQGASGVPALVAAASDGTPRYVPVNIADRVVGLFAVQAILAALFHRQRTGEGQEIEVPMFETMTGFVLGDHLGGLTYRPPLDAGGYARLMSRHRRPYQTADGHICVLIYTDKQWRSFFAAVGSPDLIEDPRFRNLKARLRHIDEVYGEAGRIFRTRTTAEWRDVLERADIPNMPMHTLATIQDDPHLKAVGFFEAAEHPAEGPVVSMRVPSRWSRTQPRAGRPAPRLGEHSREVLAEAGFPDREIAALVAGGAVREGGTVPEEMSDRQEEAV